MRFDRPAALVLSYTQYMGAALMFNPQVKRILLLGLGGGSLVKFLLTHSAATLEVVELRPQVVKIAHGFFQVPESGDRLEICVGDGFDFLLNATENNYDMIFADVFDDDGPAAFVQTDAFLKAAQGVLSSRGVLCINMWNRKVDRVQVLRRQLARTFDGSVLEYALGRENNNVVVFCFKEYDMLRRLPGLEQRALKLKNLYGLDLPKFLENLHQQNLSMISRFLSKRFAMFR